MRGYPPVYLSAVDDVLISDKLASVQEGAGEVKKLKPQYTTWILCARTVGRHPEITGSGNAEETLPLN
jgi:hypothetical protein